MAWLEQEKTGIYQICFRYQGERFKKSARTRDEQKAQAMLGRIEENIGLVERGRLTVPDQADVFIFLLSDGQINGNKPKPAKRLKLSDLFGGYLPGVQENNLPHWNAISDGKTAIEEERRLFYVGVTRAAQRLTLSATRRRGPYSCQRSRFAAHLIDEALVEHHDLVT